MLIIFVYIYIYIIQIPVQNKIFKSKSTRDLYKNNSILSQTHNAHFKPIKYLKLTLIFFYQLIKKLKAKK